MRICVPTLIIFALLSFPPIETSVYAQDDQKGGEIEGFEGEVEDGDDDRSPRSHGSDDDMEWIIYVLESMPDIVHGLGGLMFGVWPKQSPYYNTHFWDSRFTPYPYSTTGRGLFARSSGRNVSIHTTGHYFYSGSTLHGYSFRSRIAPSPLLNMEFHTTGLTEKLARGDDLLAFYDAYLNYYRVRQEQAALWWGVGVKGMQGDRTYHGPGLNFGTDLYPAKPLSIRIMANVGALNGRAVWETGFRMNVHMNRTILYAGYQRFSVGAAAIDGLISGIGLYF